MKHYFENYCKDYENIENYEAAKKDNFKGWECHHRLETHNSDGERRLIDITKKELIALNMYYDRPAEELIFLTIKGHSVFRKGKHLSAQTRKKLSEANKGKTLSAEHKKKLSEAQKGHCVSSETKKKISEARKGKPGNANGTRWYNNGKINIRAKECPGGFVPGRLLI